MSPNHPLVVRHEIQNTRPAQNRRRVRAPATHNQHQVHPIKRLVFRRQYFDQAVVEVYAFVEGFYFYALVSAVGAVVVDVCKYSGYSVGSDAGGSGDCAVARAGVHFWDYRDAGPHLVAYFFYGGNHFGA